MLVDWFLCQCSSSIWCQQLMSIWCRHKHQFEGDSLCYKNFNFWPMVDGHLMSTVDIILMSIQHCLPTGRQLWKLILVCYIDNVHVHILTWHENVILLTWVYVMIFLTMLTKPRVVKAFPYYTKWVEGSLAAPHPITLFCHVCNSVMHLLLLHVHVVTGSITKSYKCLGLYMPNPS